MTSRPEFSTPSDTEIVSRFVLAAPRELVWAAWTTPEHLRHWMLGPDGWAMPVCEVDLRPGGAWRYGWVRDDGGEMTMTGTYVEVEPPERLVSVQSWGPGWPETVNTLLLSEDAGRTTITQRMRFPSVQDRDAALATNMAEGMTASIDRLAAHLSRRNPMSVPMKFELVPVPVSDVDRAKAFYQDTLGWELDVDVSPADGVRIVQLTPPASACSILLSTGLAEVEMPVGSLRGLHLVVADIEKARQALVERGVGMGEIVVMGEGSRTVKYSGFTDPDGNAWTLQEMVWREF
jgi:uncharacterized protein YndB with AHSA1/START domain/predicted enzyme related to lactoylglutathione lyase